MRIVIEISDVQTQSSIAGARPIITADNAASIASMEGNDLSGGGAPPMITSPVIGGVVALSPAGETQNDKSGGAAESAISAITGLDGGAAPS